MDDGKATMMGWFLAQKEKGLVVSICLKSSPQPNLGLIGCVGIDYVEHVAPAADGARVCLIPFDSIDSAVPLNEVETQVALERMGETVLGSFQLGEGTAN